MKKFRSCFSGSNLLATGSVVLLLAIFTGWTLYMLVGQQFLKSLYDGDVAWLSDHVMRGRGAQPLHEYYPFIHEMMLLWSFRLLGVAAFLLILLAFIRKPIGVLLVFGSLVLSSFLLFYVFDRFPSLIKPFHLNILPYFAERQESLPDDELMYRRRPFSGGTPSANFKGDLYSPVYGVEVAPLPVSTTPGFRDEDGFINSGSTKRSDVILLGDSYLEDGAGEADIFPKRLERHLAGLTVANLGIAGYGPPQYLEVLKRYGLKKNPHYALLSFYEGNDIEDTVSYLQWKTRNRKGITTYDLLSPKNVFKRYSIAVTSTVAYVRKRTWNQIWIAVQGVLAKNIETSKERNHHIHPDLAIIKIANRYHRVILRLPLFSRREFPRRETLKAEGWEAIKKILVDFKALCTENQITPIVIFIPNAVHIYAEYSTDDSGENWLRVRDEQIASADEKEDVMTQLTQELKIELISLTSAFKRAAADGHLVYYPFDDHWNSDGRELAARFVADVLQSRFMASRRLETSTASTQK